MEKPQATMIPDTGERTSGIIQIIHIVESNIYKIAINKNDTNFVRKPFGNQKLFGPAMCVLGAHCSECDCKS